MKGKKGIAILAPVLRKKKSDDTETQPSPDNETEENRVVVGYRVAHVYDVSQTDGDPLPEFAEATGDPGEYIDRLRAQIRGLGIELIEEWIPGGADGMSEGGRITVKPNLSPAKLAATLVHELAHELIHRGARRKETTKLIRETEAEAVAFAVCRRIGVEPNSSSSDYIRLYGGERETLQGSLNEIRLCTAEILERLLNTDDATPPSAKTQQMLF